MTGKGVRRENRVALVVHSPGIVKRAETGIFRLRRSAARDFFHAVPMSAATPIAPAPNYAVAQLDALDPQRCPCGWTRRAFADVEGAPASVHVVQILEDARVHYHKQMTEIYVILEGEGFLEL